MLGSWLDGRRWEEAAGLVTFVAVLGEVDGDLAADSSRGADYQCNFLGRVVHLEGLSLVNVKLNSSPHLGGLWSGGFELNGCYFGARPQWRGFCKKTLERA